MWPICHFKASSRSYLTRCKSQKASKCLEVFWLICRVLTLSVQRLRFLHLTDKIHITGGIGAGECKTWVTSVQVKCVETKEPTQFLPTLLENHRECSRLQNLLPASSQERRLVRSHVTQVNKHVSFWRKNNLLTQWHLLYRISSAGAKTQWYKRVTHELAKKKTIHNSLVFCFTKEN